MKFITHTIKIYFLLFFYVRDFVLDGRLQQRREDISFSSCESIKDKKSDKDKNSTFIANFNCKKVDLKLLDDTQTNTLGNSESKNLSSKSNNRFEKGEDRVRSSTSVKIFSKDNEKEKKLENMNSKRLSRNSTSVKISSKDNGKEKKLENMNSKRLSRNSTSVKIFSKDNGKEKKIQNSNSKKLSTKSNTSKKYNSHKYKNFKSNKNLKRSKNTIKGNKNEKILKMKAIKRKNFKGCRCERKYKKKIKIKNKKIKSSKFIQNNNASKRKGTKRTVNNRIKNKNNTKRSLSSNRNRFKNKHRNTRKKRIGKGSQKIKNQKRLRGLKQSSFCTNRKEKSFKTNSHKGKQKVFITPLSEQICIKKSKSKRLFRKNNRHAFILEAPMKKSKIPRISMYFSRRYRRI